MPTVKQSVFIERSSVSNGCVIFEYSPLDYVHFLQVSVKYSRRHLEYNIYI